MIRMTMGRFIFGLSVASLLGAAVFLYGVYRFLSAEFPDVTVVRTLYPVVHYRGRGNPPQVTLQKSKPPQWVSINEVSKLAIGAVVVSEDWAFYQHSGYDINQIKEALEEDFKKGRFARGASTITQQVVRNVFLDKDKN